MAKLNKNGIRKTARMAKDSYEINFWIDDKHIYETIKATSVSDAVAIRAKRIQEIKKSRILNQKIFMIFILISEKLPMLKKVLSKLFMPT